MDGMRDTDLCVPGEDMAGNHTSSEQGSARMTTWLVSAGLMLASAAIAADPAVRPSDRTAPIAAATHPGPFPGKSRGPFWGGARGGTWVP